MATRTEYLKLIRPDYNDAADIADINANMDAIDAKAKELDESSGKALMEHNQSQAAHAAMAATINALMGPTGNTDTVRNLLNYLANRYKTAAGVSDWKDAPSINLKDVKNFIDQMARGSAVQWNGKKWKNPLTGESGLMDQNGYYCGGPNRANLIIQWGMATCSSASALIKFNIQTKAFIVIPVDIIVGENSTLQNDFVASVVWKSLSSTSFTITGTRALSVMTWLSIGTAV